MAKTSMSRVRIGVGFIMLAVFAPVLSSADIWRLTSEWVDFSWNVSLTETYDDNIFNSENDEQDDFITSLGFDTRFVIRHPFGQFNLFYRFSQSFYLDHDELNDVGSFAGFGQNQNLSFSDSLKPTRRDTIGYFVGISRSPENLHLAGQDRRSDLQDVDLEGIVVGQDSLIRGTSRVSYTHQFLVPVNFGLNGGYTINEYDDPDRADSRITNGGTSLSWRISPIRSVGLSYSISLIESDRFDRTRSDVYSIIYDDQFAPTWSLTASLGASVNDTSDDSVDNVTPDIDVRLRKGFKRGSAMLGYSRSVGLSEGVGGASENQAFTASGTYQHTRVWRSSVSATFSEGLSDSARTADTRRLTIRYSTGYPLARDLRLRAGYLFSRQEISGTRSFAGDVTNNQVFVGLTYGADIL
jgi:hypothetical protein